MNRISARTAAVFAVIVTAAIVGRDTNDRLPEIELIGVERIADSCAPADAPVAIYSNGARGSSPITWSSAVTTDGVRRALAEAAATPGFIPSGDAELRRLTANIAAAVAETFPQRTSIVTISTKLGQESSAYALLCRYRTTLQRGEDRRSVTITGCSGRWEIQSIAVDESGTPQ